MKPKNFPERKRQRQLAALERLARQENPARRDGETDQQYAARKPNWRFWRDRQIATLHERTATNLRDVRTKKYRGPGREYERA